MVLALAVVLLPAVANAGFLELEWTAPTTNADGSPLTDLAAYRIYTGTSAPPCPGSSFQTLAAPSPSPTAGETVGATLAGLTAGTTYWVRVSAVDGSGNESACTTAVSGVARSTMDVTPTAQSFGSVSVGSNATLQFTVRNVGAATLTGTASTTAPFSIVSGGSLNIAPGASQVVSVRFAPTAAQVYAASVTFSGGGDTVSRSVSGTGVASTATVLQFSAAAYSVTEGGTATITVTRTGGTSSTVTVAYATSNGTATAGQDYSSRSGTLTFNAGVTSQTFTVPTTQDTIVEGPETVTLTLSNPQGGATLGAPSVATLTITDDDAGGSLRFGASTYSVGESGGSVTLTVTRTGGSASGVTVAYATSNGTATAGQDYSSRTGTLTFNAGVTSQTITVPILPDTVVEGPETFTVTLSNPQGGATLAAPSVATVTITDDDVAQASLQFSAAAYSVTEGGTATIAVTRTGPTHAVTVDYATSNGTAVAGSDYTAASGTLTFAAGVMSRTFTVVTIQDTVVEGAETITLRLSNPQGGATLGTPNPATLTIVDNDVAGTVQFALAAYSVSEATANVNVTVTRTGGSASAVTVDYATTNGTATAGQDYSSRSGTLTFNAGVSSQVISIPILQDALPEGPETFTLALSNPQGGATLGAVAATTVTIVDDEPTLRLSAAAYTVGEAAGQATITVQRVGSTAGALTVDYATTSAGTAVPGVDYTPVAGTLSFAAGQASRTFVVPVLDDDVADGSKTVGIALRNAVGAWLGTPSEAVLTITDNDVAGVVQFGAAQYVVDEGAGTFQVPVTRTGGTAAGVTATYTVTGGSAAQGVDFGLGGTGTVTFPRGVTTMTIPLAPISSTLLKGPRTVELTLSNPGGGATLGARRQTVVRLEEVVFEFAPAAYRVAEGGVATVTVVRTGPVGRSVTVEWATADGTARAGEDYEAASGVLTFGAGVRSRTLTVKTVQDTVMEGEETVLVRLRNPSAGAQLGTQRTAVVTIVDNDAGGRIGFTTANHVVPENRGTYNVAVVRSGGVASGVTVDYAVVGGTATGGGVDYTLPAGTLTFGPGQTTAVIPVAIVDDAEVESNETIVLALGNPTGGALLGPVPTTTLTIVDNNRVGTVQFGAGAYSVAEGAGSAAITLTRTGPATSAVNVRVRTSDGTGRAGVDYGTVDTVVTFGVGVVRQTVLVPVMANLSVDGSRTVNLTLSGATAPAAVGAPGAAVLTITDDDSTLTFGAPEYAVAEGGAVAVVVRRTGSLVGTVSVGYAVVGGTAVAGQDYVPVAGRLTFGPGVAAQTVVIRTLVDALVEGEETIQLGLGGVEGQARLGTPAATTVRIADNPPVVRFAAAAYTVKEGVPTATLTVVRSGPATGTVMVSYGRAGGTAQSSDYTYTPGTLTFGPGVMSRTFSVGIVDDGVAELAETVVFGLSGAQGAVIGSPATATLTILDNEPAVQFSAAAYMVKEGVATATLTVVRTGPPTGTVTVNYAVVGGTATGGGVDYTLAPGTLTFGSGVMSRPIVVGIVNDAVVEGPETVVVRLSGAVGARVGSPGTATLTIEDTVPVVRFAAATYAVSEATPALTVTVTRTGPLGVPVSVDYAVTGGTATRGQDYVVNGTGRLTFGPGVTTQTFTLGLVDDMLVEGEETIELTLHNPAGAVVGEPGTTRVRVLDNDVGGRVQFASGVYSVGESSGQAVIALVRTGGLASGVTVRVRTLDGSALAGAHYTAVARQVEFGAGQVVATVPVPVLPDSVADGGRWLVLELSEPGGGATLGPLSTAILWTVDDD